MNKKRRRWVPWTIGLAATLAVVVWAVAPRRVAVDLATVSEGALIGIVTAEGLTEVRDRFVVAAPVTGRLRRIDRRPGDAVTRGETIAVIEPAPLDPRAREEARARLEAALDAERTARATLAKAISTREQVRRERERVAALEARGVVSTETLERADLALESAGHDADAARFQAMAASHEVEQARALAGRAGQAVVGAVAIRAPVAGRLLRLFETSERVVPAGTPVAELGDPEHLEVTADLLSTDAVRVTPGDTMWVTGWGEADTLCAVVRRVEPSGFTKVSALGVEEQRVNVIGDLIEPPAALGDRFRVDVSVEIWRIARTVRVPRSALYRSGNAWAVYLAAEGRATERTVSIGRQGLDDAEVLGGLEPGDRVVVRPDDRLSGGQRISARSIESNRSTVSSGSSTTP
ncbi:MAG: efflux RND transporter periplasmic adaptor subunit [Gemmatimonadales bacterium]